MIPLTLSGLEKRFGDSTAVAGIDIEVPAGAFLVLLGPSGCGKTTTLRMLAGLEEPTGGRIAFGDRVVADPAAGVAVAPARRGLGMVFQSYALWPHLRVRGNISWPLRVAGWSRAATAERVDEVLRMLELEAYADRYPAELSGGQQQRVAIARTVAPKPGVLLFDEPLSNLDARLRLETRAELVRVHRLSGATSVYVTHDQVEALAMATHIAVMRDGRVEQFGTPDDLLNAPETAFVAGFLGTPAHVLLTGTVSDGLLVRDGTPLAHVGAHPAGSRLTAAYRPDAVRLDADGTLPFDVLESTPVAGRHIVTGRTGGDRIALVADTGPASGTTTRLALPSAPAAVFDTDGAPVEGWR